MPTIEILGFAQSTFVRTVRMAAIEKGVEHVLSPLAFKSPEHFAKHPFGKMPILLHGKMRLHESLAIADYIDERFAGPKLKSKEILARARMWQCVSVCQMEAYPVLVSAGLGVKGVEGFDPAATARVLDWLNESCDGTLASDAGVSLADLFAAPIVAFHVSLMGAERTIGPRPQLGAWFDAISGRSSFQETSAP